MPAAAIYMDQPIFLNRLRHQSACRADILILFFLDLRNQFNNLIIVTIGMIFHRLPPFCAIVCVLFFQYAIFLGKVNNFLNMKNKVFSIFVSIFEENG